MAHCMCRFGSSACRFMRVLIGVGWRFRRYSVGRDRRRIMREAIPLQIAKCRKVYIRLPAQLKAQMFERVRRSRCAFRPEDGL